MEQSSSREAGSYSASQENPYIVRKHKYHRAENRPQINPILSHINPVRVIPFYL